MKSSETRIRENRVRRQLARQGYRLHKSRTDGCVYGRGIFQGLNANDYGGYVITDASTNMIVADERFDLSLEDIEQWVAES